MPKDKTVTHIKVLAAAREEFMEYGYENASMRRIGQRCDMTAAGLYRHCKDKAGLFGELVSPSIEKIDAWLEAHITRSMQTMESDTIDLWKDSEIAGFSVRELSSRPDAKATGEDAFFSAAASGKGICSAYD